MSADPRLEHNYGSDDAGTQQIARNPDGSPVVVREGADGSRSTTDPATGKPYKLGFGTTSTPAYAPEAIANTGVGTINTQTATSGLAGFFGATEDYPLFVTGAQQDPNFQANHDRLSQALLRTHGPQAQAAQAGYNNIDTANQNQVRAQQLQFANALQSQANGAGGPTAAQAQLQAGSEQNLANALAQAATYRGGNAAAGFRQAAMQRAQITQGTANQAAQLRAQEQQSAQQQLGNVLAGTRGQDQSIAMGQAGMNQQTDLANAGFGQQTQLANQEAQSRRDQLIQQYMQMGMNYDQANQQSMIQQAQFNQGSLAQQVAGAHGVGIQNSAQGAQVAGATLAAAGTIAAAAASDMHVKKNIEDGSKQTRSFLDAISPKKYEYTEEKYGQGKYLGFLAQDMEKSEMGKEMVKEIGGVKHIDTWKALSAALAALGDMHGRVKKLEK